MEPLLPWGPPPAYQKDEPPRAETSTRDLCKGFILAWGMSWPVRQLDYSHLCPELLQSNPKGRHSVGQGVKPSLHPRRHGQDMSPPRGKGFATHHQRLIGILGFALPMGTRHIQGKRAQLAGRAISQITGTLFLGPVCCMRDEVLRAKQGYCPR